MGEKIHAIEERIESLEYQLQYWFSKEIEAKYLATKLDLQVWEKREASRLSQIAKKNWLTEGDQNTKFFHLIISQRRNKGHIDHMVLPDGRILKGVEIIHNEFVIFFPKFSFRVFRGGAM